MPVAFPFGFGLSYTTFAYADLVASPESATVTVTNTGTVAGAEVVQVYVHRESAGLHRPDRTLAGFARVELRSGESATVLRERVTSPAGTTAAALRTLEDHGVRAAFLDAVESCAHRSRTM